MQNETSTSTARLSTNGSVEISAGPAEVAADHHLAPVEPVDDHAAERREEEPGSMRTAITRLNAAAEPSETSVGQREDREEPDPVAEAREHLGEPELEERARPEEPPRSRRDRVLLGRGRNERCGLRAHALLRLRRERANHVARGLRIDRLDGSAPRASRDASPPSWPPSWPASSPSSSAVFFLTAFFFAAFFFFLAGPFAARSASSSTASSSVIAAGSMPRGIVAFVVPSVTVRTEAAVEHRGSASRCPGWSPSSASGGFAWPRRCFGWAKIASASSSVMSKIWSSDSRLRLSVPLRRYGP